MSRYGPDSGLGCEVCISDLPMDVSNKDIEQAFKYYGDLRRVWQMPDTPASAFVEFENTQDAEDAVYWLDGTYLCGAKVHVELSNTRKRRAHPRDRLGRGPRDRSGPRPSDSCYACGEPGQYAKNCPKHRFGGHNICRRRSRSRSPYTRKRSDSRSRSRSRRRYRSPSRSPPRRTTVSSEERQHHDPSKYTEPTAYQVDERQRMPFEPCQPIQDQPRMPFLPQSPMNLHPWAPRFNHTVTSSDNCFQTIPDFPKLPDHMLLVVRMLLTNQGKAFFGELEERIEKQLSQSDKYDMKSPQLENSLRKYPSLFDITYDDKSKVPDIVSIKANVDLCSAHATKSGCGNREQCIGLHLCKFYMKGVPCSFKEACMYGHTLFTPHNTRVLSDLQLLGLDIEEIRVINSLSKNCTTESFPDICRFYNSGVGCKHKGITDIRCPAMHVCLHYVKGDCSFGHSRCKRSHNIYDDQPLQLLKKHGIDVGRSPKTVLEEMRTAIKNTDTTATGLGGTSITNTPGRYFSSTKQNPPSSLTKCKSMSDFGGSGSKTSAADDTSSQAASTSKPAPGGLDSENDGVEPLICLHHLRGFCLFKNKCQNVHKKTPYQWQHHTDQGWADFDTKANEDVEQNYCDPLCDECCSAMEDAPRKTLKVTFETMTVSWSSMNNDDDSDDSDDGVGKLKKVRRLSTISYVKVAPTQTMATTWHWYWKDEYNKWQKYNQTTLMSTLNVRDLEESYQANPDGKYKFANRDFKYAVRFKNMTQKNLKTGTKRDVRRRPQLRVLSRSDEKLTDITSPSYPTHWEKQTDTGGNDKPYERVEIKESSAEYNRVADAFHQTAPRSDFEINKIERIQNMELWQGFTLKKTWMSRKSNGAPEEKLLFHGTSKENVEAICQQGFDWRMSGTATGTMYGKGSYFARDAKYSIPFNKESKQLFLVRVLVGSYTNGQPKYVRPPPKSSLDKSDLYDTCVDNVSDPSIFVVFELQQAYPEYLIKYKELRSFGVF